MLKTALIMIEKVSNPYLLNNILKTVADDKKAKKSQNFILNVSFQTETNRN